MKLTNHCFTLFFLNKIKHIFNTLFFSISLSLFFVLTGVLVSGVYPAHAFERSIFQIVITPDNFPIIWRKPFAVDLETQLTSLQLLELEICNASANCSQDAVNAGALYFKTFSNEYGDFVAYYDENGKLVGTSNGATPADDTSATDDTGSTGSTGSTGNSVSQVVGSIAGEFVVSPSGSSNYTIPIEILPGTRGMVPGIAVSYDSQSGNGVLGVGWSLSGLSQITRCPQTLAQDNQVNGVSYVGREKNGTYSSLDRFCLDGQRLIAVNGNNGDDGTEYRTENGSGVKVFSYGATGRIFSIPVVRDIYVDSGPLKFVVYHKNGVINEYGYTEDSRMQRSSGSGIRVWAINKEIDQRSNYYTYKYQEDAVNGDFRVEQIDYTGNEDLSISPNASVRFNYEDRYDKNLAYNSGSITKTMKRIRSIDTYLNEDRVTNYNFYYKNVDNDIVKQTYLTSVEKCIASTGECLNSTNFEWQSNPGVTGIASPTGLCYNGDTTSSSGVCNDWDNHKTLRYPDIDGDGVSDICYRGDSGIQCRISNNGVERHISTGLCANGSSTHDGVCNGADNFDTIQYIDVNADSKADIVYRADTGIRAYIFNGTSFSLSRNTGICANGAYRCNDADNHYSIQYADINADGYSDVCYRSDDGIWCHTGSATGWGTALTSNACANGSATHDGVCNDNDNFQTINYVDINGDGDLELVFRSDNGIRVYAWTSSGFALSSSMSVCGNGYPGCNDGDNHYYIQYPDVNGDGLSDICYRSDTGIKCHYSNGGTFNTNIDISTNICANVSFDSLMKGATYLLNGICNDDDNYSSIKYTDFNADGLSDLVFRSDNEGIKLFLFDGTNFIYHKDSVLNSLCSNGSAAGGVCNDTDNHKTISFADFNGDGESDFVYRSDNLGVIRYIQNDYKKPLIEKITDGMGISRDISYKPMTDNSVYIKGTGAAYPSQDIEFPKYVVSEQSTTDGHGGVTRITYKYGQARVNLHGRGDLGFGWTESANLKTGLVTKVEYHQEYPFTNMVAHETQRLHGNLLSETLNTAKQRVGDYGQAVPYVSPKVIKTYDDKGVFLSKVATEVAVNEYGDIVDSNTYTTANNAHINLAEYPYKTFSHNTYGKKSSLAWHEKGLVTENTIQKSGPDGTSPTVYQSYIYNTKSQLEAENGWVVDAQLITHSGITKTYGFDGYDGFGNMTSTTIMAPGATPAIETRVVTVQYDDARGQFAEYTTNEMGHRVHTSYDPYFGVPLTQTDANGLITTYSYNDWGELTDTYAPGGNKSHTEKNWCTINCVIPAINGTLQASTASFVVTSSVSGGINSAEKYAPDVNTYYDQLGREIRKQTTSFDGRNIYVDTAYDDLGRVVATTQPYFSNAPADKNTTTTTYDALSRPFKTNSSDGGESTITYDGFNLVYTTKVKDPYGGETIQTKTEIKNVIGQTLEVIDAQGNTIYYEYDAQGNKTKILTPSLNATGSVVNTKGTITSFEYDVFGRKTDMFDPDMGHWSYVYNVLSELISQTDANTNTTTMLYDRLGRLTKRTDADGMYSEWIYNDDTSSGQTPAPMGIGKLDLTVMNTATGVERYKTIPTYDLTLGLPTESTVVLNGDNLNPYITKTTYDRFNRPEVITYPETGPNQSLQLKYVYENGVMNQLQSVDGTTVYWKADIRDAHNRVNYSVLGNGANTWQAYDKAGRAKLISVADANANIIYEAAYQFDTLGNLREREVTRSGVTTPLNERYNYDNLNRLKSSTENNVTVLNNSYDVLGNIRSKTGVGTYSYGTTAKPHAITSIGTKVYAYDNNGNLSSDTDTNIYWTAYNKPFVIHKPDKNAVVFSYGPNRARYYKYDIDYVTNKYNITDYIGGLFERVTSGAKIKYKHYIKAGGKTIAIYTVANDAPAKLEYMQRDYQGSVVAVSDETGNVKAQLGFDAFGDRKPVAGATTVDPIIEEMHRGYTGHEHLDGVGLIHMNGRVYNPTIGRFLSADPFVQAPSNLQSYNRYSYVLNNPMSYTDPSGYFSLKKAIKNVGRAIALGPTTAAIAYSKPVRRAMMKYEWARVVGSIATSVTPISAAAYSAYLTDISGGSFGDITRAGAISFGTAYMFSRVHGKFEGAGPGEFTKKVLAHGVIGGISSYASGGSFNDGFIGAAVAQAFFRGLKVTGNGFYENPNGVEQYFYNGVVASLVGGMASSLAGGDFEQGAKQALYGRMFNEFFKDPRLAREARDQAVMWERLSNDGSASAAEILKTLGYAGREIDLTTQAIASELRSISVAGYNGHVINVFGGSGEIVSRTYSGKDLMLDVTIKTYQLIQPFIGGSDNIYFFRYTFPDKYNHEITIYKNE